MPARAWIRLPSGRHFNLIAPDPEGFSDADLAMRLARTYRWGGESLAPLPLSVAQHSLLVLALTGFTVALARPQAVVTLPNEEGVVILAIDVSGSSCARCGWVPTVNQTLSNRSAIARYES